VTGENGLTRRELEFGFDMGTGQESQHRASTLVNYSVQSLANLDGDPHQTASKGGQANQEFAEREGAVYVSCKDTSSNCEQMVWRSGKDKAKGIISYLCHMHSPYHVIMLPDSV
jgi:hypothetical protein